LFFVARAFAGEVFLPVRIPFARWVRLPQNGALFRIYSDKHARTMHEWQGEVFLVARYRNAVREEMGIIAGQLLHAQLTGCDAAGDDVVRRLADLMTSRGSCWPR